MWSHSLQLHWWASTVWTVALFTLTHRASQSLKRQERSVNSLPLPFCVNLRYSAGITLKGSQYLRLYPIYFLQSGAAHSAHCIRTDGRIYICHGCFRIVSTENCMSRTMKMDLIQSKCNYSNTVIALTSPLNRLTWPCGCFFYIFCGAVTLKTRYQPHMTWYKVMAVIIYRV